MPKMKQCLPELAENERIKEKAFSDELTPSRWAAALLSAQAHTDGFIRYLKELGHPARNMSRGMEVPLCF